eukprot:5821679-Prymnesium_polylepis.1
MGEGEHDERHRRQAASELWATRSIHRKACSGRGHLRARRRGRGGGERRSAAGSEQRGEEGNTAAPKGVCARLCGGGGETEQ